MTLLLLISLGVGMLSILLGVLNQNSKLITGGSVVVMITLILSLATGCTSSNAGQTKGVFKIELSDCKETLFGNYKCGSVRLYETTYTRWLLDGFIEKDIVDLPIEQKTIVGTEIK